MTTWLCFNIRLLLFKCCFLWVVFFFLYIPTTFKKILLTPFGFIYLSNMKLMVYSSFVCFGCLNLEEWHLIIYSIQLRKLREKKRRELSSFGTEIWNFTTVTWSVFLPKWEGKKDYGLYLNRNVQKDNILLKLGVKWFSHHAHTDKKKILKSVLFPREHKNL